VFVSSAADAIAACRRSDLDFLVLDGELVAGRATWWRPAVVGR